MRTLLFCLFFFFCSYSSAQVKIQNNEPGFLQRQLEQDSCFFKKIQGQSDWQIKGYLAKEDIHYIAALARQYKLKRIDLSKTQFREIGFGLFENCDSLHCIMLPPTVRTIAKNAFKNCGSLSEIELPKSLTSIGSDAFLDCKSLKKVTINKNLSWIGTNAFSGCPIKWTKIKGKNNDFFVKDNHLYAKNRNRIY